MSLKARALSRQRSRVRVSSSPPFLSDTSKGSANRLWSTIECKPLWRELSLSITRIHRGWGDCEMHSMKRRTLPSGRAMIVAATCVVLGFATFAYGTDRSAVRHSKGRTIVSGESPKAKLSISRGFGFIGTQQVKLHGNAEAEQ